MRRDLELTLVSYIMVCGLSCGAMRSWKIPTCIGSLVPASCPCPDFSAEGARRFVTDLQRLRLRDISVRLEGWSGWTRSVGIAVASPPLCCPTHCGPGQPRDHPRTAEAVRNHRSSRYMACRRTHRPSSYTQEQIIENHAVPRPKSAVTYSKLRTCWHGHCRLASPSHARSI